MREGPILNYTTNQKGGEGWTEYNLKHEHTDESAQYLQGAVEKR